MDDEYEQRDCCKKAWLAEQPAWSEELAVAETRLMEAKTRYLQELDRVCALSSPRVAFERRLDYVSQTSPWFVINGMIGHGYDSDKNQDDNEGFGYQVVSRSFDLERDDTTIAFLSKEQGNVVVACERIVIGRRFIFMCCLTLNL
jgi:hypothetical protein